MVNPSARARSSSGQSIGLRSRISLSEAPRKHVTRRQIYALRLLLGQTPTEAREAMRRIRELARRVARGEVTEAAALASLGGGL